MTQDDKLDYLIDFFKKDSIEYKDIEVTKGDRRKVLRSLMNIRIRIKYQSGKGILLDWK